MKKFLILFMLIYLTACLPPVNKNKDGGFLSEKPCGPPCFHGVVHQVSTQTELLQLIDKPESIFYGCKFFDLTSSGGVKGLTCNYVDIGFSNNLVKSIRFIPSDKISTHEVINKFGSPDSVYVFTNKPEHSNIEISLYFCFDKLSTILAFEPQSGEKYIINSNTTVSVIFYESTELHNQTCNEKTKNFYPWNGYGEYLGFPP